MVLHSVAACSSSQRSAYSSNFGDSESVRRGIRNPMPRGSFASSTRFNFGRGLPVATHVAFAPARYNLRTQTTCRLFFESLRPLVPTFEPGNNLVHRSLDVKGLRWLELMDLQIVIKGVINCWDRVLVPAFPSELARFRRHALRLGHLRCQIQPPCDLPVARRRLLREHDGVR